MTRTLLKIVQLSSCVRNSENQLLQEYDIPVISLANNRSKSHLNDQSLVMGQDRTCQRCCSAFTVPDNRILHRNPPPAL